MHAWRAMTYERHKVPQIWWHMHEINVDGAHSFHRKHNGSIKWRSRWKKHCDSVEPMLWFTISSVGWHEQRFFLWKDVIVCAYMFCLNQNVWRTYTPLENGPFFSIINIHEINRKKFRYEQNECEYQFDWVSKQIDLWQYEIWNERRRRRQWRENIRCGAT